MRRYRHRKTSATATRPHLSQSTPPCSITPRCMQRYRSRKRDMRRVVIARIAHDRGSSGKTVDTCPLQRLIKVVEVRKMVSAGRAYRVPPSRRQWWRRTGRRCPHGPYRSRRGCCSRQHVAVAALVDSGEVVAPTHAVLALMFKQLSSALLLIGYNTRKSCSVG